MKPYENKVFQKLLVANRGEIAVRVLRAASELHIRTVAIYTYEDRYSLHRYKADEAYQIGNADEALKPYLDIEEIIGVAKRYGVDAIHPGYGFLSENATFARRCAEENITFIGPSPEAMEAVGDKIAGKNVARSVHAPVIEDSQLDVAEIEKAYSEAERIGYPVIIKAAAGGGGRGMRVVRNQTELSKALDEASNEAKRAFGNSTLFIEKYVENPKHIEVQVLGDNYGNLVHLYERDCSVQRRFQKVVEIAPAPSIPQDVKNKLYEYALSIMRSVDYSNAGTVEFLLDAQNNIYFIEVNPRIQVEHTITEEITGIDIVRTQILVAQGYRLSDPYIYIRKQEDITVTGFAIQCRITTEDPQNGFKPDFGRIIAYRSATGFGIRLDEGSAYTGAVVTPYFDSMVVKVTAWGRTLRGAAQRMHRALREFRIRGVKTNIGFLENVITDRDFQRGAATVGFIEQHPELLQIKPKRDRGTKVLRFLANVQVNGNPDVKVIDEHITLQTPIVPDYPKFTTPPAGSRQRLIELGREEFIKELAQDKRIHYTDTTFRDAHQSLLATRMRTTDMLKIAPAMAHHHAALFSMEVWGGATFDTAMRFLKESPWQRLQKLREAIPNIIFQMLFRGSNAVGYKAYPDNLIIAFIEKAAENGIDLFRIFDSLNWIENMKVSIKAVRERTNSLAEAAICYTGDILDPERSKKYNLQYYIDLAKQLEDEGAHLLCIKDMAGLLKPYSAGVLVNELKNAIKIPIHLHTHDTSSLQAATYLQAIEAGVDVIDVAIGAMSGLTSQPNFNSVVAMLKGHPRENAINLQQLNKVSDYWAAVRTHYYPFESGLKAGTAEVFEHEMPGGQYSNLQQQAKAIGVTDFELIKKNYIAANQLLGDIVKVTPSSKVVGDLAIFMAANHLTEKDVLEKGATLSFPESVKGMLRGEIGQPHGGFPEAFQRLVLKDEPPFTKRPNDYLEPINLDSEFETFKIKFGKDYEFLDFLSYLLYPAVFEDYHKHKQQYGDVSQVPTKAFWFGMNEGEEILVEIDTGKTLIVKFLSRSNQPDENGDVIVAFEMNGQSRRVRVKDSKSGIVKQSNRKVSNENEIGAPLQGKLSSVKVKVGDNVKENTPLFVIEAMKMESVVTAPKAGKVKSIILHAGALVSQDDVVVELE